MGKLRAPRAVVAEELGHDPLQPALSPTFGNRAPLYIWRNNKALVGGASSPQGFSVLFGQRAVDPSSKDDTSDPVSAQVPEMYVYRKSSLLLGTLHHAAEAGEGLCDLGEGSRRVWLTVPCCLPPQVSFGSLSPVGSEESMQLWTARVCHILASRCSPGPGPRMGRPLLSLTSCRELSLQAAKPLTKQRAQGLA